MKNKFSTLIRIYFAVGFLFFALSSFAQSTKISIQGIIKKSDGRSIDDGVYAITFRLYNVLTGGAALWTEVQPAVEVSGGIYNAQVGSVNNLNLPFNEDYYLSVQVEDAPEITPRQPLTKAPYALSLKGTGNIFPSTGTIGVGTNSPSSGYSLHVKNASGQGNQLFEGTTGAQIDLKKGTTTAFIGLNNTDNLLRINSGNNTVFQRNGADKLEINTNGIKVTGKGTFSNGISVTAGDISMGNFVVSGSGVNNVNNSDFQCGGTTKMSVTTEGINVPGHLSVTGTKSYNNDYAWMNASGNTGCSNGTFDYSISCSKRVRASEFNAYSDARIKKEITTSDAAADLDILRSLKVRDYQYVDEIAKGDGYKKGFIAQEVKEVFPESVSLTADFIPDIYEPADEVLLSGTELQVLLKKAHGLKLGDKVRIFFENEQKDCQVASVAGPNQFSIAGWHDRLPNALFVYGRMVEDFHQVDYDRIHTLNVSVIQELLRKKDALELERAALKRENDTFKTALDDLEFRMQKIEASISN